MEQTTLFDRPQDRPLASRMRPRDLDEFAGQQHLLGEGKVLRRLIESDRVNSMIFWGPPGVGKTTLAQIIARRTKAEFVNFSAVTSGVKEIKAVMQDAEARLRLGQRTILFVDEIHRFNKAQQDAFLPFVEKGSIVLIGATTENPSFEINAALLSRCKVFVLKALTPEDLTGLLRRALTDPRGFGDKTIEMEPEALELIANFANGDARTALNTLEMAVLNAEEQGGKLVVDRQLLEQCTSKKSLLYDKKGEEHYNLISALHKSMRNSDPDAAVYWLARMLEAGEDPLYVARRLIRFASEDIGLADSRALEIAVAAYQACHFNGMPECSVNLAHAVIYLSLAPRSNAAYRAYEAAKADAEKMLDEPVPLAIRNAPTRLMKELDYGKGYVYAHDTEEKVADLECLPAARHRGQQVQRQSDGTEKHHHRQQRADGVHQGGPVSFPHLSEDIGKLHRKSGQGQPQAENAARRGAPPPGQLHQRHAPGPQPQQQACHRGGRDRAVHRQHPHQKHRHSGKDSQTGGARPPKRPLPGAAALACQCQRPGRRLLRFRQGLRLTAGGHQFGKAHLQRRRQRFQRGQVRQAHAPLPAAHRLVGEVQPRGQLGLGQPQLPAPPGDEISQRFCVHSLRLPALSYRTPASPVNRRFV